MDDVVGLGCRANAAQRESVKATRESTPRALDIHIASRSCGCRQRVVKFPRPTWALPRPSRQLALTASAFAMQRFAAGRTDSTGAAE